MSNLVMVKGLPANTFCCKRCGARIAVPVPMPVTAFGKWVEWQEELHRVCTDAPICTGVSAQWCPRCGDCACPRDDEGELAGHMDDPGCPLHAPDSTHAERQA